MDSTSEQGSNSQIAEITSGDATLTGELSTIAAPRGVVLFAHGSGSSRHSPRNQYVAEQLRQAGFATLLIDLLTAGEELADLDDAQLRFNIDLLSGRVADIVDWLAQQAVSRDLPIGLFGASTGAAAALGAAAARPELVGAVVSRGGRPDLAGLALPRVQAPTLLIVGGNDYPVIGINRDALQFMSCERSLEVVPGATHLFEEAGALSTVARLAGDWFRSHLGAGRDQQAIG
jgi:putative phosphoribosyl transferase